MDKKYFAGIVVLLAVVVLVAAVFPNFTGRVTADSVIISAEREIVYRQDGDYDVMLTFVFDSPIRGAVRVEELGVLGSGVEIIDWDYFENYEGEGQWLIPLEEPTDVLEVGYTARAFSGASIGAGSVIDRVESDRVTVVTVEIGGDMVFRASVPVCVGDANMDGVVDLQDFGILKNNFSGGGGWGDADFNGDGIVDLQDFGLLKENFGMTPSTGCSTRVA